MVRMIDWKYLCVTYLNKYISHKCENVTHLSFAYLKRNFIVRLKFPIHIGFAGKLSLKHFHFKNSVPTAGRV